MSSASNHINLNTSQQTNDLRQSLNFGLRWLHSTDCIFLPSGATVLKETLDSLSPERN